MLGAAAFALWLGCAPAPAPAAEPPSDQPPETTVAVSPDRTARMGLDVLVNGRGPFRFLVDTGSDRTVVSEQLAGALQLPSAGMATLHSFAGVSQVGLVRVESLLVSTRKVATLNAAALKAEHIGADGLLGIDSLAQQRITLDFRSNVMTVAPGQRRARNEPKSIDGAEVIVVRARPYGGQLVITDARVGGVKARVVIDTGAATSVANMELRRQLSRRRAATPALIQLNAADGASVVAELAIVPELTIGEIRLSNVPLAFYDAHPFRTFHLDQTPSLLLGMDLMSLMDEVAVDFADRSVRFVVARPDRRL